MHLAEGMLPMSHAVAWTAAGAGAVAWSIRGEVRAHAQAGRTVPSVIMAGVTSLLFAATLLPLPVPVIGATSHICLTPVLALLVGIRRIVWATFFVLLLQAVFFAHGGLTTLGFNTLSLGLFGPIVTVSSWALLKNVGFGRPFGLATACALGALSVYILDAIVVAAALADVADWHVTFFGIVLGFAPVQLPLSILEATVSVWIVKLLFTRRPDLLSDSLRALRFSPKLDKSTTLLMLLFGISGCRYEGIDRTVFGATAEAAGRSPTDSLLDFSQGEFGLTMSIIILFGLGFIAGRCWERLFGEGHDALPR